MISLFLTIIKIMIAFYAAIFVVGSIAAIVVSLLTEKTPKAEEKSLKQKEEERKKRNKEIKFWIILFSVWFVLSVIAVLIVGFFTD